MLVPTALIGCQVWQTAFDYQVRLALVAHDPDEGYRVDAELVIEVPFLLRASDGAWHEIDPGVSPGAALAPVIDLFRTTIVDLRVNPTGGLSITFDSGAELNVSPDPRYRAWSLIGHGVTPVTVGPGGETEWQLAD